MATDKEARGEIVHAEMSRELELDARSVGANAAAVKARAPYTIYEALQAKLGRAPTHAELRADIKRILGESGAEVERRRL